MAKLTLRQDAFRLVIADSSVRGRWLSMEVFANPNGFGDVLSINVADNETCEMKNFTLCSKGNTDTERFIEIVRNLINTK